MYLIYNIILCIGVCILLILLFTLYMHNIVALVLCWAVTHKLNALLHRVARASRWVSTCLTMLGAMRARTRASSMQRTRVERRRREGARRTSLTNVQLIMYKIIMQVVKLILVKIIFFTDVCRECGHVIAVHQYTFSVDEDYQVQLYIIINKGGGLEPPRFLRLLTLPNITLHYLTLPALPSTSLTLPRSWSADHPQNMYHDPYTT